MFSRMQTPSTTSLTAFTCMWTPRTIKKSRQLNFSSVLTDATTMFKHPLRRSMVCNCCWSQLTAVDGISLNATGLLETSHAQSLTMFERRWSRSNASVRNIITYRCNKSSISWYSIRWDVSRHHCYLHNMPLTDWMHWTAQHDPSKLMFLTQFTATMRLSVVQTTVESRWTRSLAPTSWHDVSTSVMIRLILVGSQHQICSAGYRISNWFTTTTNLVTLHTHCRLFLFTADLPLFRLK